MKKNVVILWLFLLFTGVAVLFWSNDWIYQLPYQKNYTIVNIGESVNVPSGKEFDNNLPIVLHFFNPDCPSSRFNLPQFNSVVEKYYGKVNFAVVLMGNNSLSKSDLSDKFGINVPVLTNSDLPNYYGIYSTPQAVIIDAKSRLQYRGNYNRSRYCTDTKTEFVKIALEQLLKHQFAMSISSLNPQPNNNSSFE